MEIITVTGYKGGCGKTTTAIHLATYLSERGRTVLVDGDPNHSASKWSRRGDSELPFTVVDQRQALKIVGEADYLVMDTPARPETDDMEELAKGCDLLILPTQPDVLNLEPMLMTAEDLGNANYRALVTVAPPPPNRDGEIMLDDLKEGDIPAFESIIRRTIGFAKAAKLGIPLRDYKKESRFDEAWKDYERMGDEVMEILK